MAIFQILSGAKVAKAKVKGFRDERELQSFFEKNLEELLGIRFLKAQWVTSHGGRIDTIGLDENGFPVIIEYKEGENNTVINQSLFYLAWLMDHKGEFQLLVQSKLGPKTEVNWDSPRIVIIASSYNQYDKYAVTRLSDNIELKRYSLYDNQVLLIEDVELPYLKNDSKKQATKILHKDYTIEEHLAGKSERITQLFKELREKIVKLDDRIHEKPLKLYVAYELNRNFVEIEIQSNALKVYLDIPKEKLNDPKNKVDDMSSKGHWATGDAIFKISSIEDLDYAMSLIKQSYESKL